MYLENFWDNRDNPSVRRELLTLVRNVRRVKSFAQLSLRDPCLSSCTCSGADAFGSPPARAASPAG